LTNANLKRERNIQEVNKQLEKATFNTTPRMTGPQTSDSMPKASNLIEKSTRMIYPGSKDAPKFKSDSPRELRRFIRLMEDLWQDVGVTDDKQKKIMLGKYADQNSEEEWAAFDAYKEGSWKEFKEELLENYPEAAAAERGTPARIRQICSETHKIVLGDMPSLYAFRRAFMAEAKKLQKDPEVMANRELVELFISCFTDSLASAVLQYLNHNPPKPKAKTGNSNNPNEKKETRRPEDKYDLEDVCRAALQVSENSQGMFHLMNKNQSRGLFLFSQPVTETKVWNDKLNELEGEQALEKDRLESLDKNVNARMAGLEEMLKILMKRTEPADAQGVCKGDCRGDNCKSHANSNVPNQKWGGRPSNNERCFWCGSLEHFVPSCEDLKEQIRIGYVKMNPEGKLRLKDGSFIPKYPADATLKERTEKYYARNQSQYFYGDYDDNDQTPSATSVMSQLLNTENDDKRTIAQLKAELDLRRREEALALKEKMLEQNLKEKKLEQTSGSARATQVLELLTQLTDEELAVIKSAKSGFN
jgi:hypothetical protein